ERSANALSPNAGAFCGDDGNACLGAGVCSDQGRCEQPAAPAGTPCGAGVGECVASTCDGAGSCMTVYAGVEGTCGNSESPACRAQEHCDSGGACVPGEALPLGSECGSHATCSGDSAAPTCSCNAGYEADDGDCVDIDECTRDLDACDAAPDACVNDMGSFRCECPA